LSPSGLPDYSTGPADHSVSNHQRDDRGPPGCPAIQLVAYRPLYRLRQSLEGSPVHADRIEFTKAPNPEATVTDWSFSFRCSPPRVATTQLRFNTPRLFAAGERTVSGGGNAEENRRFKNPLGQRVKKHNTGSRSYR
jgi:hypothetical protein